MSIGFRVLVSRHPAIQTTGLLILAPAGLSPAEHASLRWTHNRTCGSPASGSRTRPHAFVHDTSCRHGVVLVEAAGGGARTTIRRGRSPRRASGAGDPHVRLCVQRRLACSAGERPAGARVRSPVVWIAGWRETKTLKPIDNVSRGEATSHRAVTTVNAKVASKVSSPEGRAPNRVIRHGIRTPFSG